jgi:hypothetical protein
MVGYRGLTYLFTYLVTYLLTYFLCVFRPLYSVYCLFVNVYYCHRVSTQLQFNDDDDNDNNNNNNRIIIPTYFISYSMKESPS